MSSQPNLAELKQQAKALRSALESDGSAISHSKALEIVARQHGYRDWNTLHSKLGNRPKQSYSFGQIVSGSYLGQSFSGQIIAVRSVGSGEFFRLTVRFDEPVDIIKFEGWSSFRQQVNVTLDQYGQTIEKTSDGQPHLLLDTG